MTEAPKPAEETAEASCQFVLQEGETEQDGPEADPTPESESVSAEVVDSTDEEESGQEAIRKPIVLSQLSLDDDDDDDDDGDRTPKNTNSGVRPGKQE